MEQSRPIVLSIAGFDPCGGAGILADIKTFEQHRSYGLGICTAQTLQTEDTFFNIRWEEENYIFKSLEAMLLNYDIKVVKIGIVENLAMLMKLVSFIHQKNPGLKIVIDPIFKSSSGFSFRNEKINEGRLTETLSKVFLITPNYQEVLELWPSRNEKESAIKLSAYCNVLLKGGHNPEEKGVDYLFMGNRIEQLNGGLGPMPEKHGSGCVLSAAITAYLALGCDIITACKKAKKYIETFLTGTSSKLGYHHV